MAPPDPERNKHQSRTRRGPFTRRERERVSLNLDMIVDAAIRIADDHGPDAVTMRALASDLGVGVMSLYWYVATKRDLEGQMCLRLMEETTSQVRVTGDWRADLADLARSTRRAMHRHAWLVDLVGRIDFKEQTELLEGKALHMERIMKVVESLPTDMPSRLRVVTMVDNFTRGFALWEIIMQRQSEALEETEVDTATEAGSASHPSAHFTGRCAGHELMLKELESVNSDQQFENTLQTLLDGIEIQVARGSSDDTPPLHRY